MDNSNLSKVTQQRKSISGTKELTGIALFTALSAVLSYLSIPAPYAGFLFYEIWEIPIVIAFLLIGVRAAVIVTLLNALILFLVNQGVLATGPVYNMIAIFVMLLGVGVAHKLSLKSKRGIGAMITASTISGLVIRTIVMTIVNYSLLPYPPPLGFSIPRSATIPLLPLIGFFNATVALYTIPISYWVLKALVSRYKFVLAFPLPGARRKSGNTSGT